MAVIYFFGCLNFVAAISTDFPTMLGMEGRGPNKNCASAASALLNLPNDFFLPWALVQFNNFCGFYFCSGKLHLQSGSHIFFLCLNFVAVISTDFPTKLRMEGRRRNKNCVSAAPALLNLSMTFSCLGVKYSLSTVYLVQLLWVFALVLVELSFKSGTVFFFLVS